MKFSIAFVFLSSLLVSCATLPQKFPRSNYSAINGDFSVPVYTQLSQVKGLPKTPYESICRQQITRKNWWGLSSEDKTSSSAYLDGGVLITAAHNFGDSILGFSSANEFHLECQTGYAPAGDESLVYDNYHNSQGPLEFIHPDYSFTFAFLNKRFGKDAALVKLCPLANANKSAFRLATLSEISTFIQATKTDQKPTIFVAGYPHGTPDFPAPEAINGGFDGSRLMHVKTYAEHVSEQGVISYSFSNTVEGMSGGPVWFENVTTSGKEYVIIGVHVTNGGAFLLDETIIAKYKQLRSKSC